MKKEDLMIGDWVQVYEDDDCPMEGCYVTCRVENINDFGDIGANCNDHQEKDVKPIPLTPEILEKNGFKEDSETNGIYWRPDCRKFCIVKELDTWYFAFRVLGETVGKSSGYICISECNYVHKLQHILKDLEIEKEIVL